MADETGLAQYALEAPSLMAGRKSAHIGEQNGRHQMTQEWQDANKWEQGWWSDCCNTYEEERKQQTYMDRMGMVAGARNGMSPVYNFMNKRVLDMGGGPCSVLLKGINIRMGVIVDPCLYPDWVKARYDTAHIEFQQVRGEDVDYPAHTFDVGIMYNVLQHTEDPERVVQNMRRCCDLIRVYEWINVPISPGHIHTLTESNMNEWLGGKGYTEQIFDTLAYFGVFVGGLSD